MMNSYKDETMMIDQEDCMKRSSARQTNFLSSDDGMSSHKEQSFLRRLHVFAPQRRSIRLMKNYEDIVSVKSVCFVYEIHT